MLGPATTNLGVQGLTETETLQRGGIDLNSRLGLRVREAAQALGVSERLLRQLLPVLPHVRLGSTVVIPVDLLREWLREQSEAVRRPASGA